MRVRERGEWRGDSRFVSLFLELLFFLSQVTKLKVHVNYFPTQQQQQQQSPAFMVGDAADQFQLIRVLVFECCLVQQCLPTFPAPPLSPPHASLRLWVSISSNSSPRLVSMLTFLSASSTLHANNEVSFFCVFTFFFFPIYHRMCPTVPHCGSIHLATVALRGSCL